MTLTTWLMLGLLLLAGLLCAWAARTGQPGPPVERRPLPFPRHSRKN